MEIEGFAPSGDETVRPASARIEAFAAFARDQSFTLQAIDRLVQRARAEPKIAAGAILNRKFDAVAVLRTIDEGQQDFESDRRERHGQRYVTQ